MTNPAQVQPLPRSDASADADRLASELRRKAEEEERLLYLLSHDLKGPLHTIRGFSDMMLRDLLDGRTETLEEDLKRVGAAAERMQRLLDAILVLSRVARPSSVRDEVRVGELALDWARGNERRLREAGASVVIADGLPSVPGDAERLRLLLSQLLDNALKFTAGVAGPKIEVGGSSESESCVFYVRDNGTGIAPEAAEHLFEVFRKPDSKASGLGLGLALVRRIAESHGGRAWAESRGSGLGATFYFSLPCAAAPADA